MQRIFLLAILCAALRAQVSTLPYSLVMEIETVQTLSNGIHIRQPKSTTKMLRDSQGRTRTEIIITPQIQGVNIPAPPATTIVNISDPTLGFGVTLYPDRKVARRFPVPKTQPFPAPVGATGKVMMTPTGPGIVSEPTGGSLGVAVHGTPTPTLYATKLPPSQLQTKTEQLGSRVIEGLLCTGTRNSTIYPVNMFGNDAEIIAVSESWISTDLGIAILSINTDPRLGESTFKASNISRSEPDPALFIIPPGYTFQDQP